MDPNRDSRQTDTGRISFEDWMRITAACGSKVETLLPEKTEIWPRRLMTMPLVSILGGLCAAAIVTTIMLWQ